MEGEEVGVETREKGEADLGAELGELCPQAHEVGVGRLVFLRPRDLHLNVLDALDDTHGGGVNALKLPHAVPIAGLQLCCET